MSNIRFQQTFLSLLDCQEHLLDDLKDDEVMYKQRLLKLCKGILDDYLEFVPSEKEMLVLSNWFPNDKNKYKTYIANLSYDAVLEFVSCLQKNKPENYKEQLRYLSNMMAEIFPEMIGK